MIRILSLVVGMVCIVSCWGAVPSDNLVAFYPFSGNAHDSSGNGLNGIVTRATLTTDRFGNPNSAYHFSGGNQCIRVPNFPLLTSNFTVSVWMRTRGGSKLQICLQYNFVPNHIWNLSYDHGAYGVGFNCWDDVNGSWYGAPMSYRLDTTWTNVIVKYDGNAQYIYINGSLLASRKVTVPILSNALRELAICDTFTNGDHEPWNGDVDDVRLYSRALSDSEITALANEGGSPFPDLIAIQSPTYNRRPTFQWHPVPGAQSYVLSIDTSKTFSTSFLVLPLTDTSYGYPVNLPFDTIFWRARTNASGYSPISRFVVIDSAVPVLIPYEPKLTLERRPMLQWHGVVDGGPFTVSVANNPDFVAPLLTMPVSDTEFSAYSVDLPPGPIYWRVKSNISAQWSSTDQFVIVVDSVPFLYRYNGAEMQAGNPSLRWRTVARAVSYRVECCANASFSSPFFSVPIADTAFVPPVELPNGKWFWHASDNLNYSLFAPADSFIVDGTRVRKGNSQPALCAFSSRMSHGILMVRTEGSGGSVALYSLSGSRIAAFAQPSGGNTFELNVLSMRAPAGTYLVQVRQNGTVQYREIFIQY
jgi:hypothetical protein